MKPALVGVLLASAVAARQSASVSQMGIAAALKALMPG